VRVESDEKGTTLPCAESGASTFWRKVDEAEETGGKDSAAEEKAPPVEPAMRATDRERGSIVGSAGEITSRN